MKISKYLLASTVLAVSAGVLSFTATTTNQPSTTGVVYAASDQDNPVLDQIMPNKKLQLLVLENMKSEAIVPDNSTIAQFTTADQFKTALSKLTTLEWVPGETGDHSDPAYINLEPLNGGNGLINSSNQGNYSLEGLQFATNLTTIDLHQQMLYGHRYFRNDITDVTPLEHLTKLTEIDLHGNRIQDITPISKLPNVTYLDISYNSITDLSSLNIAHYSHLNYNAQFIQLPEKKLSGTSYNLETPFVGKLPQGVTYNNSNVSTPDRAAVILNNSDPDQPGYPSIVKLMAYYSGSDPAPKQNNGSLDFINLELSN
ncbi:leucine-rich repeat domain-containing protein [Lentilactobacillus rapi]|nr:leucine-rich repeat domain-containing protein [Lentilactobacillus rapi]